MQTVSVEIKERTHAMIWFHADPKDEIQKVELNEEEKTVKVWLKSPVTNVIINGIVEEAK